MKKLTLMSVVQKRWVGNYCLSGLILLLALFLTPSICFPITIMKNVGHGDCYVVISDGRVILIDLGPPSSVNGLISLLKNDYTHYDRIVITHVHSDHVGGLITAEQYAKQEGAALSTDKIISNRGEHDLHLLIRDSTLSQFLTKFGNGRPVVGISDEAINALKLNDEYIEVKGYPLEKTGQAGKENQAGLVVKITEIRDGIKRATLFLCDIEQKQQAELFTHPDAKEIFKDVYAVTLPHHGRPTTLSKNFFEEIKRLGSKDVIVLHSDRSALHPSVAQMAAEAGIGIKSTAAKGSKGTDVYVNLFDDKTYYRVGKEPVKITTIVKKEKQKFLAEHDFSVTEVADAVAKYSGRSVSAQQKPGTPISMPSDAWLREEISNQRNSLAQETDSLIFQLQSSNKEEVTRAESVLAKRVYKLNVKQIERINEIRPGVVEQWERAIATPTEGRIRDGLSHHGWVVARNRNIDNKKLLIQAKWRDEDSPGVVKYIATEGENNTWNIYNTGPQNSKGVISYGKQVGVMRTPSDISIRDYEACEYCGEKAVGWCHMRKKYVCDEHRYFTQGGTH